MLLPSTLFVIQAVACLSGLTGVAASPATLSARQLDTSQAHMAPNETVYFVIPQRSDDIGLPSDIRRLGGISQELVPAGPGNSDARQAEWARRLGRRPSRVLTQLENAETWGFWAWTYINPDLQRPAPRVWIYQIATSPNMLLGNPNPDTGDVPVWAIGGVLWSQIRSFTSVSLSDPELSHQIAALLRPRPEHVDFSFPVQWMANSDFDPAWEQYGGTRGISLVPFLAAPDSMEREMAREVMAVATSDLVVPDAQRRQRLRQLLNWDVESDPQRDFPLFRAENTVPSLMTLTFPLIDWSQVDIPAHMRLILLSGLQTVAQCQAALGPFKNYFNRPKGKREAEQGDACQELSSLTKAKVPTQCQKINTMHIDLVISDDYSSGTYDRIGGTLEGPAGTTSFEFATEASRGQKLTATIKAKDVFADDIDINSSMQFNITAQGVFSWTGLHNDAFQIHNVKIRAECTEDQYRSQVNRYLGIDKWMQHPAGVPPGIAGLAPLRVEPVASFSITRGDWLFSTSCKEVKDINYEFNVANLDGAGTYDKVFFTLGREEDKNAKEVLLGDGLSAADTKSGEIDHNEVFGKEAVPISDLTQLTIGDRTRWTINKGDEWVFQGIKFTATCADSGRKLIMDKFDWVHKTLQNADDKPVWNGTISTRDWFEVDE